MECNSATKQERPRDLSATQRVRENMCRTLNCNGDKSRESKNPTPVGMAKAGGYHNGTFSSGFTEEMVGPGYGAATVYNKGMMPAVRRGGEHMVAEYRSHQPMFQEREMGRHSRQELTAAARVKKASTKVVRAKVIEPNPIYFDNL